MITDKTSYYYQKPICTNCVHWGANKLGHEAQGPWNAICEEGSKWTTRLWNYSCEKCKVKQI